MGVELCAGGASPHYCSAQCTACTEWLPSDLLFCILREAPLRSNTQLASPRYGRGVVCRRCQSSLLQRAVCSVYRVVAVSPAVLHSPRSSASQQYPISKSTVWAWSCVQEVPVLIIAARSVQRVQSGCRQPCCFAFSAKLRFAAIPN